MISFDHLEFGASASNYINSGVSVHPSEYRFLQKVDSEIHGLRKISSIGVPESAYIRTEATFSPL